MSNSYTAYGFNEDGTNQQATWQGEYIAEEDTRGRGYPDWIPDNTTLLPPGPPDDVFDTVTQTWKIGQA